MAKRKTVAILGLGIFGSTLARDLTNYNVDVIAVDKDMANVERVAKYVNNCACADFTDLNALRSVGIGDADIGIVTSGTMLEEAILGVINLKELGVGKIIAKAKNTKYAEVLKKIGADETVSPEKEYAKSIAKQIISNNIIELFDIDNEYTIFDSKLPEKWANKSLIELKLRSAYNVNVVGVRRNGELAVNFDPNEKLLAGDELLIIADNNLFKNFDSIIK